MAQLVANRLFHLVQVEKDDGTTPDDSETDGGPPGSSRNHVGPVQQKDHYLW
jgi:hypothetical protein